MPAFQMQPSREIVSDLVPNQLALPSKRPKMDEMNLGTDHPFPPPPLLSKITYIAMLCHKALMVDTLTKRVRVDRLFPELSVFRRSTLCTRVPDRSFRFFLTSFLTSSSSDPYLPKLPSTHVQWVGLEENLFFNLMHRITAITRGWIMDTSQYQQMLGASGSLQRAISEL